MAPQDVDNIGGDGLDDLDLDAAIGAAEELVGAVGDDLGLDIEEVMNAGPGDDNLQGGLRKYDFNRPSMMSRAFEQNLTSIGENFAKIGVIDFTSLLRMTTTVEYKGLRQSSFSEYMEEMPNPTCAAMITAHPFKGYCVAHVDLSLCFVFMKKLMGGQPEAEESIREFTEIERGINAELIRRFNEIFKKAAAKLLDIDPKFVNLENNPNYLSGIAEGENLLIMKFIVKLDTVEGLIEYAIPLKAFGPVKEIFDPREEVELRNKKELKSDRKKILSMVQGVGSEMTVLLGEKDISLEDVINLTEGDILHLPQSVTTPLKVQIEGEDAWLGEAGRLGQNRAIKLIQQLNKE